MPSYNLQLVNNSAQPLTLYAYQTLPGQPPLSLVWYCSPFPVMPGAQYPISWDTAYSMVWGQGQIMPGATFNTAGMVQADPQAANTSTFTTQPMPSLSNPVQGPPPGSLVIKTDVSVPPNQFAVGIGMSGSTSAIVGANPNMNYTFSTDPTYWVAASQADVQVGTILDIFAISMNAQVTFPPGVYQLICTLDQNGQWSIH